MKRLLLTLSMILLLGSVAIAQRADNYPPDDKNVQMTATNLPIVWIDVDGKMIEMDSVITGRMKIIYNRDGQLNYVDTVAHPGQFVNYDGYISIRYRGHSSFTNSDKKPYTIHTMAGPVEEGANKLKVALLGMGKDHKWGLLAPYSDKSMLRDVLAYQLAEPWMEYTPEGRFCEVYLDGIYYGVYVLTELVSKGKRRLNLDDPGESGNALTGGYIMQVDRADEPVYISKYHPLKKDGSLLYKWGIYFQYKMPDYDEITSAQRSFITNRINEMENAFASSDYMNPLTGYRKYIDVTSFADYQLMMELSHNVDAYRLSAKFFKRCDSIDSRFKMVIWDFNLAFGNSCYYDSWRYDTWMYQNNDIMYVAGETYLIPFWWYKLNEDSDYTTLLKERWKSYRRGNLRDDRWEATVDSLVNKLTVNGAVDRNSQAWPRWGRYVWPNYYIAKNYADEIAYLKQWLANRIAWMDTQFGYDPNAHLRGDVDWDDKVNIDDLIALIDILINGKEDAMTSFLADVNLDGKVSVADITMLIDYLLSGSWYTRN